MYAEPKRTTEHQSYGNITTKENDKYITKYISDRTAFERMHCNEINTTTQQVPHISHTAPITDQAGRRWKAKIIKQVEWP